MSVRKLTAPSGRPRLASWILVGGVIACLAGFYLARSTQMDRARARFDAAVVEAEWRLQERLRVCGDLLRGIRGLVQAGGDDLDRERFRTFVQAMDLEHRYPGLLGVSYGVPLRPGELEAVEARLRDEHRDPGLHVYPGTGFGDDGIVLFAEPEEANAPALGFNSASSPDQRGSLIDARDSGDIRTSPPMPVAQAPRAGPGLVLRIAVYRGSGVPETTEARREAFSGYANAIFLLQQLAAEATARLSRDGVRVRMVDVTDMAEPRVFLQGGTDFPRRWWHSLGPGGLKERAELGIAGRRWALEFSAGPSFFQTGEVGFPWLVGLVGLLISLLLAAFVRSVSLTGVRARDLAERMTGRLRMSESRLRAITQVMPDVIYVVDSEGRYIEVHTGDPSRLVAPAEMLAGRKMGQVLPAPVAARMMETIRRALDEARVQSVEYVLESPQGVAHFEARVAPMGIEVDGKPCVICVARDVTERHSQEEAHLQAQKLEGLGLLAGGIAHDFNNLLAAMQGYLSLGRIAVEEGKDPSTFLERMDASIRRAADLSRQLLAYSGRAAFKVERLDLNALVEEMGGLLSVTRAKKVTFDLRLQPGLPPILGDRAQLQQVVMNLVTNASEAIGSEAGLVELSTEAGVLGVDDLERRMAGQDLAPGPYVTLMVRDNGIGMNDEVLARVFDPFFTTKPTGRGLGLSAMRGILRAHRAGIEIQSRPGQGTTFKLHFPAEEGTLARSGEAVAAGGRARSLSGTLLVADDESILRDTSRMMIERMGMGVIEAADGEEAWTIYQARHETLRGIVLDLTMPRMGGAEVHRLIRRVAPRFPIVLCSGYSREALPELVDLDEPTVFLQKPFNYAQLEAAIREVLDRTPGEMKKVPDPQRESTKI